MDKSKVIKSNKRVKFEDELGIEDDEDELGIEDEDYDEQTRLNTELNKRSSMNETKVDTKWIYLIIAITLIVIGLAFMYKNNKPLVGFTWVINISLLIFLMYLINQLHVNIILNIIFVFNIFFMFILSFEETMGKFVTILLLISLILNLVILFFLAMSKFELYVVILSIISVGLNLLLLFLAM